VARRLKSFERRLDGLAATLGAWSVEAEHERDAHRADRLAASLIRAVLENAGIDPTEAPALRRFEENEPPPPEAPARGPLGGLDPREILIDELERLAQRMRGDPPSLATATPVELFAYYGFGDGAPDAPE
jgi:hypothetical protein